MLDLMFDIPSRDNITKVIISRDMVIGKEDPEIIFSEEEKSA